MIAHPTCPTCSACFKPKRPEQAYCSRACAAKQNKGIRKLLPKPCAACGKTFDPVRRQQIACSVVCGYTARNARFPHYFAPRPAA